MPDPVTFPSATSRHQLPYLFAGQAQREFFVNESLARIDMLLHPTVSGLRQDPPAASQPGESWLIGTAPTAEWADHPNCLASWQGDQWTIIAPTSGMVVRDQINGALWRFDDSWVVQVAPEPPEGGENIDLEARACLSAIINALAQFGIFSQPGQEPVEV